MINVKKFPNRKLYCMQMSSYVTLKEVLKLYEEDEIKVVDSKTGKDLTGETLLKACIEDERYREIFLETIYAIKES